MEQPVWGSVWPGRYVAVFLKRLESQSDWMPTLTFPYVQIRVIYTYLKDTLHLPFPDLQGQAAARAAEAAAQQVALVSWRMLQSCPKAHLTSMRCRPESRLSSQESMTDFGARSPQQRRTAKQSLLSWCVQRSIKSPSEKATATFQAGRCLTWSPAGALLQPAQHTAAAGQCWRGHP